MFLGFTCYDPVALNVLPFGLETRGDPERSRDLRAELRQFVILSEKRFAYPGVKSHSLHAALLLISAGVNVMFAARSTLDSRHGFTRSRTFEHDCD